MTNRSLGSGFDVSTRSAHRKSAHLVMKAVLVFVLLFQTVATAQADDTDPLHAHPWKLTLGEYLYSDYSGSDINLRWRHQDTDVWFGMYLSLIHI